MGLAVSTVLPGVRTASRRVGRHVRSLYKVAPAGTPLRYPLVTKIHQRRHRDGWNSHRCRAVSETAITPEIDKNKGPK